MAGDVHHVVDAAEQPEVAVFVHLAAVTGEIPAGIARPIILDVAIRIAVNRAHHRGPGLREHQIPAGAGADRLAFASTTSASMPGNGRVAEPGFVA